MFTMCLFMTFILISDMDQGIKTWRRGTPLLMQVKRDVNHGSVTVD